MSLELIALSKSFDDAVAVDDVTIRLPEGRVLSLLGPSGCGKTTTLRLIAGFEEPNSGRILVKGRDVTGLPARRRNIGMVFQSYALFPHLSVADNVAFGLDMRNVPRAESEARVARALAVVRMEKLAARMPRQLSGGQQQRIALARALVIEPDLLLLDEPLSALDLKLREEMRDEIYRIVRELGITTVFVTHDQGEALVLSDVVAVMDGGRLEQIGTPRAVYREPRTSFVARFIGSANVLAGCTDPDARAFRTELGFSIPLSAPVLPAATAVALRPEDIDLGDPAETSVARVARARFLGDVIEYTLVFPNGNLTVRSGSDRIFEEGALVSIGLTRAKPVCLSE
jgi:ABC-type Fe3+/spermidine/putrescine transport system ATPase subunit